MKDKYEKADLTIKGLTLLLATVIASVGLYQYFDNRKQEYKKTYYEERVKVIGKVHSIINELNLANSESEKQKVGKEFHSIFYGAGVTYLDGHMYEGLRTISQYIGKCVSKFDRFLALDLQCEIPITVYGEAFSSFARVSLSKGWNIDFDAPKHPWTERPL